MEFNDIIFRSLNIGIGTVKYLYTWELYTFCKYSRFSSIQLSFLKVYV